MRLPRTLFALPVAVALVVTGCSTGSDDTTTATTVVATTAVEGGDPTTTADGATTTTGDATTTAGDRPAGSDELCDVLQAISDYDTETSALVESDAGWDEVQQMFIDSTDDVVAIYDDAIALDTDLTEQLTILRDFTDGTAELAAESTSLEDLGSRMLDDPAINDAGQAGLELNAYAESTCGFSTGNN